MFILSNFLNALATILNIALELYKWIMIARVVISWLSPISYNPVVSFIYKATEPILYRVRSKIPVYFANMDFSPIVVFFAIIFLQIFLVESLMTLALRLA